MMAVDVSGWPSVSASDQISLRVPATAEGLFQAGQTFESFCIRCGLSKESVWQAGVALDEVVSNCIGHGLSGQADARVELRFEFTGGTLTISVFDNGPAFDPLALPEPDTVSPLEARRPGGLGVHFVRALMDHVSYERNAGLNQLTFSKRIGHGQAEPGGDPPAG